MDPAAAPSGLWGTHGFVNTVQLNTTDTDIWSKSTGISFVLFMVIGFCATLGAIGIALVVYLICRRCRRLRAEREARDVEAAATVPEPKEMYLVVHPGGSADVAHKDLDDSPRKMVLRNKPIQLSSAVLDLSSATQADGGYTAQGKEEPSIRVLNLTANSRLSGDGSLPASRRIQRIRLDSVDMSDSPKIMACHPSSVPSEARRGQVQASQSNSQQAPPPSSVQGQSLSRQSTASENYQDEALLLTPRFQRSEM